MKNRYEAVLVLGMLVAVGGLAGCASIGQIKTTRTPKSAALSAYKSVAVYISSVVPDSSNEMVQLESGLVDKLRDTHIFSSVFVGSNTGQKGELSLDVRIKELSKVSPTARFFFGAFAGRAKMIAEVNLIDNQTEGLIGSFEAEGKSSGGTIFAGTTSQGVDKVIEEIVKYVDAHK